MVSFSRKSFINDQQLGFDLFDDAFTITPLMVAGDLNLSNVNLPIQKTALERARLNLKAIKLLKELGDSPATEKQQAILAKFTGLGFPEIRNKLFSDNVKGPWASIQAELSSLLTQEQLRIAAQTTQYAHYTPESIVKTIWSIIEKLGVEQGLCLEAGAGTGHFKGYLPSSLKLDYEAIELDTITGAIAQKNYPTLDLYTANFMTMGLPKHRYDVAVGNPPYASINIKEGKYKGFKIHDAFIAKQIDSLRDGGLGVFVTSTGTLDKIESKARDYIAKRSSLIAAYRLPQNTFKALSGTEVVTDILIFQRTKQGNFDAFSESIEFKDGLHINEYFHKNPDHILGTLEVSSNQYGECLTVTETLDWQTKLNELINELPVRFKNSNWDIIQSRKAIYEINPGLPEDYFYTDSKGHLRQVQNGLGYKLPIKGNGNYSGLSKKEVNLLKDYVLLRNTVLAVYDKQLKQEDCSKEQAAMNLQYDIFVQNWGPINQEKYTTLQNGQERYSEPVIKVIDTDPECYRVASIEDYDSTTGKAEKGPIFTEQVINIEPTDPKAESAQDALKISMNRQNMIDFNFMSEVYDNRTKDDMIQELGESISFDPELDQWVLTDEYLSGDVKSKLAKAQELAKTIPSMLNNIARLEKVIPKDIPWSNIPVQMGQTWIPVDCYRAFAKQEVELDGTVTLFLQQSVMAWNVNGSTPDNHRFSTARKTAREILHAALNQKSILVKDKVRVNGNDTYITNEEETAAANDKVNEIKEAFVEFVNNDHQLCTELSNTYNAKFNRSVPRKYDGSFLELPGLSRKFKPRSFQLDTVWQTICTGNVYYAHTVGAGKTSTAIIAAREMKRLGLIQKPVFSVLKATLKQWATEWYRLYPTARVLVMDSKKLDKKNRRRFLAKLATGNYDGIVMTHGAFTKIPLSEEYINSYIGNMLDELEAMLKETEETDRTSVMQLNRQLEALKSRQESLLNQGFKDGGITFEESGIDGIWYDEAVVAKKIGAVTNQGNLKGVDTGASAIGVDLKTKFDYLKNNKAFCARIQMSATPITNSMIEIRTLMAYFIEDRLYELDLGNFDAWMAEFADTVTELEIQPSGKFNSVTRVMKFVGASALGRLLSEFMNFVTQDMLDAEKGVQRPMIETGERIIEGCEKSQELADYQLELQSRLDNISNRKGPPQKGDDIVPCVITDGRKAAIDLRLVGKEQLTPSKLDAVIEHAVKRYHEEADTVYYFKGQPELIKGSTQLIFCDLIESNGFNVYRYIKEQMIEQGGDASQIAIISDFATDIKKRSLYQQMNSGKIRVLIGSSFSCGTGVNVQRRLRDISHVDIGWRPDLIEQREGRGIRQGNLNEMVRISAFVTKGTTDAMMWSLNSSKQRMIEQIFRPFDEDALLAISSISDIESTNASQMAIAKAIASGRPEVLEQAGLENEVAKLEKLQHAFTNQKYRARCDLPWLKDNLNIEKESLKSLAFAKTQYQPTKGDQFNIEIGNQIFNERPAASDALMEKIILLNGRRPETVLGSISNFNIISRFNSMYNRNSLYLQFGSTLEHVAAFDEVNPVGIIRKLENMAASVFDRYEFAEDQIKKLERNIKSNEMLINKSWPFKEELQEKIERLEELNLLLAA